MGYKCCVTRVTGSKRQKRENLVPRLNITNEWVQYGYSEEEWWALPRGKRWRLRNPEKQRAATRSWLDNNKEYASTRHRKYQLRRQYGLTEEEYGLLLERQAGCCAICNTDSPTGKWKVFAVDHDHKTGLVRGLLCNECNRGMGLLRDSSELLRKAADYLDHHIKTQEERQNRV